MIFEYSGAAIGAANLRFDCADSLCACCTEPLVLPTSASRDCLVPRLIEESLRRGNAARQLANTGACKPDLGVAFRFFVSAGA